jgi:thiamine pyrophosphokinase
MRAVIIANGELNQPVSLLPDDILIAADGGAKHCLNQGIHPSLIIGDLDSLDNEEIGSLEAKGAEVIKYPTRKDFTDLEIALQYARDLKVDEVVIYAALGNRWDQTIANILLPTIFLSTQIRLVDGGQEFLFINGPGTLKVVGESGDILSLIPLSAEAKDITTENLEYSLDHEKLAFGSTRGISNVLTAKYASLSLQKGILLCIITHNSFQKGE